MAGLKLALNVVFHGRYGYFCDELYYIACSDHELSLPYPMNTAAARCLPGPAVHLCPDLAGRERVHLIVCLDLAPPAKRTCTGFR
ncbi:MAG TPA: hypothetical protein PK843_15285 [bacterium]|nr:hypothetical protein [bacterium]